MPHNKNTKIFGNFLYLRTGLTWTFIEISQFIMSKLDRNLFKKSKKSKRNYVIFGINNDKEETFRSICRASEREKEDEIIIVIADMFPNWSA